MKRERFAVAFLVICFFSVLVASDLYDRGLLDTSSPKCHYSIPERLKCQPKWVIPRPNKIQE